MDRWPEFFTEDCFYKVTARRNHAMGMPIGEIYCESKAMLRDRVVAIQQTSMYVPRIIRHAVTNIRIREAAADGMRVRANFFLYETLSDAPTTLFLTGEYHDRIVEEDGVFRFAERVCLHDSIVVPTSLIYPI
jgi:anthranilate 1,2-dioxygenase small subunit